MSVATTRETSLRLRGVSETLLIPLASRALAMRCQPAKLHDPVSVQFCEALGVDLETYTCDRWNRVGILARTRILDRALESLLRPHQKTVVVNLGAGLCSRFWRLGTPAGVRWIDLDLPDVMSLKHDLLQRCDRDRSLERQRWTGLIADVTQPDWMERVAPQENETVVIIAEGLCMYLPEEEVRLLLERLSGAFPGGVLLIETWSKLAVKVWGMLSRSIRRTGASVQWGLSDPRGLEDWNSNLHVEKWWSPGDEAPREWGLLRYAPRIRRSLMKIMQVRFGSGE